MNSVKFQMKNNHIGPILDHSFLLLDVDLSHSVNNALEQTMRQYKKCPSIVINSAGITRDNWMVKLSEMDFDSVIDVNLKVGLTFVLFSAFDLLFYIKKKMILGNVFGNASFFKSNDRFQSNSRIYC